ncbi:hypothetical protein MKY92_25340 [Paenibacillus sp. FSL R5-0623]
MAKNRKIGVSFKPEDDLDGTIRKLAYILDEMLVAMVPKLY